MTAIHASANERSVVPTIHSTTAPTDPICELPIAIPCRLLEFCLYVPGSAAIAHMTEVQS